jgi:hypothetical protein
MKSQKPRRFFAILEQPYPRMPGILAERINPDLIGVYTCSETYRKYTLIAKLDNMMQVLNGPPDFQPFINKNYHILRPLRPFRE